MSPSAGAAIHIRNHELRYAVAGRDGGGVRLGRHEFEERPGRSLLADDDAGLVQEVSDVLRADWGQALPDHGHVVVHPPEVYSFFVPLPVNASAQQRRQHVLQQAALVTGTDAAADHHVVSASVRPAPDQKGRSYEWEHILVLPSGAYERVQSKLGSLVRNEWSWTVSTEAVARVPVRAAEETTGVSLLIGTYETHTEFSLVRGGTWQHGWYTEAAGVPGNVVYFLRTFLNQQAVLPADLAAVRQYGEAPSPALRQALQEDLGHDVSPLDPAAEREVEGADLEAAFAPCLGAVLVEGAA